MTCIVINCKKVQKVRKMCGMHYARIRRGGSLSKPERCTWKEDLIKQGKSWCPKCQNIQTISRFNKNKNTKFGIACYCKPCSKNRNKRKYDSEYHRSYNLKKNHNITSEEYNKMFVKQNKLCGICQKDLTILKKNNVHLDHCHKTGKIRGILCLNCNFGLGSFKDNEEFLEKAIQYLKAA